jgi:hypothetical protein
LSAATTWAPKPDDDPTVLAKARKAPAGRSGKCSGRADVPLAAAAAVSAANTGTITSRRTFPSWQRADGSHPARA